MSCQFFFTPVNGNINFDNVGIGLLSISLIFHVFRTLTEVTPEELIQLQKRMQMLLKQNRVQLLDELITEIEIIKAANMSTNAASIVNIIFAAFGFILFSVAYNYYPITLMLILIILYLTIFSVFLFLASKRQIQVGMNSRSTIRRCIDALEDPLAGLPPMS